MTKTIGQLWYGNLEPCRYFGMHNAQMKRQLHWMDSDLRKIQEILGEDQKKLMEEYDRKVESYIQSVSEQAFCDGFCMGAKLTAEALIGAEKLI